MRGRIGVGILGAAIVAVVAGCGGDSKQEANESQGTYTVRIVKASFPPRQQLAERTTLAITVRNESDMTIPNVGVSIGKQGQKTFSYTSQQAGLADPQRPIWIVDSPPRPGTTAYVDTWAFGRLASGETKTFTWGLTALKPGVYTVDYRVNAGLDGKAIARLPGGDEPTGQFHVAISGKPSQACVADNGEVVREPETKTGKCPAPKSKA